MNARAWARNLARYRMPSLGRSIVEILITVVPFLALWTLMWVVLDIGYWLSLLLALPAAGFLVRLFMIQHDCGHGAFFRHRVANDWVGRVIGVLTLTPYDFWRRTHAIHHGTSGNLERRGIGDVDTLTVCEYLARSKWGRLRYRLYRHPIVMFGLGPAYLFILQYRLPRVLRDHPELGATGRLTLIDSFKCVRLVLWDESRRRLVSFRDMREYRMHARTPV
jgi:omega-6 fatty acid desaturase (delta-12 desaturase)